MASNHDKATLINAREWFRSINALNWIRHPDGNRSWAFFLRHAEAQAAGQTSESSAPTERGRNQHQESAEGNDLQAQTVALRRQLEVLGAEVQRLSDENNHLRQQVTAAEKTSSELPATVQTLTAQYRESEALRSDQMILLKTQERQLAVLVDQLRAVQQALDIVQRTRAYRLLRRLGRWKFVAQILPQSAVGSPPRSPSESAALTVPDHADPAHLTPSVTELVDLAPAHQEAETHQQSEFDTCYGQVRHPKKRSWVYYSHGAEARIVERLRRLGLEVYDYEVDVADYRRYFVAARYLEDFPNYYPGYLSEKSLEHYVAAKLLGLDEQDIYVDIASEHSPVHQIYRRLFGAKTYRQDLGYPPGLNADTIGGDAANMPVPEGFATKMALHCSFEHFEGDSDSCFIREAARVLRPGGAVSIIPLYLFEEYAIQIDPAVALPAGVVFENDAVIYCAQGWNNCHGRFYDPEHLLTRVCSQLNGLTLEIYRLTNVQQVDESCYARFAMVIRKPEIR